jgi:hypothetical protein
VLLLVGCRNANPCDVEAIQARAECAESAFRAVSAESRPIVNKLAQVRGFAIGGVGIAGTTSEGETWTVQLSRRPDAIAAFTWIAINGDPAGQLYAYWALRTLAPEVARRVAILLERDRSEVAYMHGCAIFRHDSVQRILRLIQGGLRDMPRPVITT